MRRDYRPDIDGLRAIAVLSVILFHYKAKWLPGGFAGVDVFFVLSGYLITKHLFEDIQKHGFAIGSLLGRFYNKRIRRIVPALFAVLAITLAAGWFLLMPGDYATTGASASYSASAISISIGTPDTSTAKPSCNRFFICGHSVLRNNSISFGRSYLR